LKGTIDDERKGGKRRGVLSQTFPKFYKKLYKHQTSQKVEVKEIDYF
jgi:hypothetical protein